MQSRRPLGVVLLLVLLGPRGNLDVLFIEHTHHPGGNLVVDNGLVVLANDVNAEFLEKKALYACDAIFIGEKDLQRCRRF